MPSTPFFSAFGPLLFGRAPRNAIRVLRERFTQLNSLSQLQEALGHFLPDCLLSPSESKENSRQRIFPPCVTFWAFLAQVLNPNAPCREIVRKVHAWWRERSSDFEMSVDTSAYCQARARLPDKTLVSINDCLGARLQRNVNTEDLWRDRDVVMTDGTNLSMPDTPENQEAYPQPSNQKRGCGFPMMKMVALFSLASGALLHVATGTLHVHECQLFRTLWQYLQAGQLLLADRGFCSFFNIVSLLAKKVDSVMRLHQGRPHDMRRGKHLGDGDRLVLWQKPKSKPKGLSKQEFAALPDTLTLRQIRYFVPVKGFRTKQVILVTTLLDPVQYPAQAIAELYFQRWTVELHFREIKTVLRLDVLRCLTPEMILKEVHLHLIAYNFVRLLMQEAAHIHHVPLQRLSFKGTLDTLRHWADVIHASRGKPRKQAALITEMLSLIARDLLPLRPNRSEPRCKKRRPKNYHLMTKPRHQMHVPKHRNRPAKQNATRPKTALS